MPILWKMEERYWERAYSRRQFTCTWRHGRNPQKKKNVDRLGTERDVSWLYHGTTLRNTTRTALFHFFLITFSVKIGKCSPGSAPEAATVYKIFLSPSIGAVSRNFETNMYVFNTEDTSIQSYLQTFVMFRFCCEVLHTRTNDSA